MTEPASYFQNKRLLLDYQSRRLVHGLDRSVSSQKERLARLAASLDAMSPLKVLGRGYAMAQNEAGQILKSYRDTAPGDRVTVTLGEGGLTARVEEVHP